MLTRFTDCVERASIDEAYVDLTEMVKGVMAESCHIDHKSLPSTFVAGYDGDDSEEGMVYVSPYAWVDARKSYLSIGEIVSCESY